MNAFLILLRAGIRSDFDLVSDFDFGRVDWAKVDEMATVQNVVPLVFDGYQQCYEKRRVEAPMKQKLQWYVATQQAEKHYKEHLNAIRTMTEYLAEKGFKTMVLKGYSLSLCYPKPSHRPCSDIDIYQFGKYREADDLLEKNAKVVIDRSHHHHTVFCWNGVSVENHYDFSNQYSHRMHRLMERHLKRIADEEEPLMENGILLPSPNLAVLFGLIHTASEFAAGAISIRQLCDWWLMSKKYEGKIDWQKVEAISKETGFYKFLKVWNELARFVFESDLDYSSLSEDAYSVLGDVLDNKFALGRPVKRVELMWWKMRRWWCNRWKMRLVYTKENLAAAFFVHLRSHWLNPAELA